MGSEFHRMLYMTDKHLDVFLNLFRENDERIEELLVVEALADTDKKKLSKIASTDENGAFFFRSKLNLEFGIPEEIEIKRKFRKSLTWELFVWNNENINGYKKWVVLPRSQRKIFFDFLPAEFGTPDRVVLFFCSFASGSIETVCTLQYIPPPRKPRWHDPDQAP